MFDINEQRKNSGTEVANIPFKSIKTSAAGTGVSSISVRTGCVYKETQNTYNHIALLALAISEHQAFELLRQARRLQIRFSSQYWKLGVKGPLGSKYLSLETVSQSTRKLRAEWVPLTNVRTNPARKFKMRKDNAFAQWILRVGRV